MDRDQREIKKAATKIGKDVSKEMGRDFQKISKEVIEKQLMPKTALGLSDAMVEGMYGQAYRLYNTGKYKEASQVFRLLIMLNSAESKYAMGMAACFHMMKEYQRAINAYMMCSIIDSDSPVPHYHSSDCYIQMNDSVSATIALNMAIKRAGEKTEYKALKDRALMMIESLKKEQKQKK